MQMMFRSIRQASGALFKTSSILLVFMPPIISVLVFLTLFFIYWQTGVSGLSSFFSSLSLFQWLQTLAGLSAIAEWMAIVFLLFLFVPLAFFGSILLTSFFVMPVVLRTVVNTDFKHLQKKQGGSLVGSLVNILWAIALFVAAFFMTLPLWFLPGFQVAIPLFLTAWLNKKVFLYDVLQDYASKDERKLIEKTDAFPLLGMGLMLGLLNYVPLVFFITPVLSAFSYTYYGLNALERHRKTFSEL